MRHLWFALVAALLAMPVGPAVANDWGDFAMISSTLGVQANRLCIGEGLRVGDIGCPSYAPSVTTAGDVSVTGNLSANKFIGDGSSLTGIAGSDRIVSGTTSVIASQDRSITFATSGTQRIVVGEDGRIGFGTVAPSARFEMNAGIRAANEQLLSVSGSATLGWGETLYHVNVTPQTNFVSFNSNVAALRIKSAYCCSGGQGRLSDILIDSNDPTIDLTTQGSGQARLRMYIGSTYYAGLSQTPFHGFFQDYRRMWTLNDTESGLRRLHIDRSGHFGVGTTITGPSSTLHVSGTTRISSWTVIASEVTPTAPLEVYGLVSATAFVGDGSGLTGITGSDRIVSGTTSIIANENTSVTFTTAGNQRMTVGENGRVGIGTAAPEVSAHISGSLMVAGNDNPTCGPSTYGTIRRNPTTGSMQVCVQR